MDGHHSTVLSNDMQLTFCTFYKIRINDGSRQTNVKKHETLTCDIIYIIDTTTPTRMHELSGWENIVEERIC